VHKTQTDFMVGPPANKLLSYFLTKNPMVGAAPTVRF